MGEAIHQLGAVGAEPAAPVTTTETGGTTTGQPMNQLVYNVGVAPVMEDIAGGGKDSFRVHTSNGAPTAGAPDLLDNQAMDTSQALVPVDNPSPPGYDLNSSQAAAAPDLLDDVAIETNLSNEALVTVDISEPPAVAQQTEATPVIAGIGRIERNNAPKQAPQKRERITVPERSINGGFDFKFEPDPNSIDLCDLLTPEEYHDAIVTLNETLRPSRSKAVDTGLLVTGPLVVPLAFWGYRHSRLVKKRKLLLVEGITNFNDTHPDLYMRYNRTSASSFLTIEKRKDEHITTMTGVEESWMDREPVV